MSSVIWHDLECGGYLADIPFWQALARDHGGPVLDVGAGTGRTSLALARAGHAVTALDSDPELLAALHRRADGLPVETVTADARTFVLDRSFPLCIVPMQTVQLLGGEAGRLSFLGHAREHLQEGGVLAIAITDEFEEFELRDGQFGPMPDVAEIDGVVYCSQPTAVRREHDVCVLERRRERVEATGTRTEEANRIDLDLLTAARLEDEAMRVGLRPLGRRVIDPTDDHVGSEVVMFGV